MDCKILLNLVSILFSGIFSVVITLAVQRKTRKTDLKYELLIQFTENRPTVRRIILDSI